MRTTAQAPRGARVFDELARRLREMVRDETTNTASGVERFKVLSASPLRIEQLTGDLVLEEGDPDVTISKGFAALHVAIGDLVWVAHSEGSQEFHVFDVVN